MTRLVFLTGELLLKSKWRHSIALPPLKFLPKLPNEPALEAKSILSNCKARINHLKILYLFFKFGGKFGKK